MTSPAFSHKGKAREWAWSRLQEEGVARFPLPPHGRIPNFEGAREAADRLLETPPFKGARRIKVNPDSPQRWVRQGALARGIEVYMPTPRLRAGFKRFDPETIPEDAYRQASQLSTCDRWSQEVAVRELPQMDAVVCGSVAVTRSGHRCGKGHGYGDLEMAILRELGHPPVPVATTVHPLQVVAVLPHEPNDLSLSLIVTPEEVIRIENPPATPGGIDWEQITEETLRQMPVLQELRALRSS